MDIHRIQSSLKTNNSATITSLLLPLKFDFLVVIMIHSIRDRGIFKDKQCRRLQPMCFEFHVLDKKEYITDLNDFLSGRADRVCKRET